MAVAPPLSSREVRRTSKEALDAVHSLGRVVNGNAELLKHHGEMVRGLHTLVNGLNADIGRDFQRLHSVPSADSTFWQRLRWLVRGQ